MEQEWLIGGVRMAEYNSVDIAGLDIWPIPPAWMAAFCEEHYKANRAWFHEHTQPRAHYIIAGSRTGNVYWEGGMGDRPPRSLEFADNDVPILVQKYPRDKNVLTIKAAKLGKFESDDNGFECSFNLLHTSVELGGLFSVFSFRNVRYADLLEKKGRDDASVDGVFFPVIWDSEALKLKAMRGDTYLPEEPWSFDEALKVLKDDKYWHPKYDSEKLITQYNIETFAERETAEHVIRQKLNGEADDALRELRQNGLSSLRDRSLEFIFHNCVDGIQSLRRDRLDRSPTKLNRSLEMARNQIEEYQLYCSELGSEPMEFDYISRLAALREHYKLETPFEEAAKVLVDTMRQLGMESLDRFLFKVTIEGNSATVSSESYIDHENVNATVDF
jgi:hypothetical protein